MIEVELSIFFNKTTYIITIKIVTRILFFSYLFKIKKNNLSNILI